MNLHYKIIEVWPDDHLVVVRYYTDIISEEMMAASDERYDNGMLKRCRSDVSVTLPIPAPEGAALHDFLVKNAPFDWFNSLEAIANPNIDTSLSTVQPLLNQEFTTNITQVQAARMGINAMSDSEIDKLINDIVNTPPADSTGATGPTGA